ncbi:MAG: tRNA-dihydrouridine synthase [Candidatus Falkowbacteria bacterium]|nr:tRNA-dihydrouridine synthase [Candidatus Falkowbacteria bacterium]
MKENFWHKIKKPILALAPMAGFSDSPFRIICSEYGADVVYSEMASVASIFYHQKDLGHRTFDILKFDPAQKAHYVVQIFGSEPEHFAVAARLIEQVIKPDGIDINFGCPVGKVIKQGAGADLMKDLPRAREVVKAVIENTSLPVSVKIRAGAGAVSASDFLDNIADLPVSAVMIHGRTLAQGFVGEINCELIKEARKHFSGIILANGGIDNLEQARKILSESDADGLGLARGSLGRPWLFREIKNDREINLSKQEIAAIAIRHAELEEKLKGPGAIVELRRHLCWYAQGIPGASHLRSQLVKVFTSQEIKDIFNAWVEE